MTDRGEVVVEHLRIGDTVITASGKPRPIRWIGHSAFTRHDMAARPDQRPVCVKAGALADGVPARDLWVSPAHALYFEGQLVAAVLLVNGASITRAEQAEAVTYWHVELDAHDLLVAEGAPAESFRDDGTGRRTFQNAAAYAARYGHDAPTAGGDYAPRLTCGKALKALRARIDARAGLAPPNAPVGLTGNIDLCDGNRLVGWAYDADLPDEPVRLAVLVDGRLVAQVTAEAYRTDVEAAGLGEGRHGYDIDLGTLLIPGMRHIVEVRRSADGALVCAKRIDAAGAWTELLAA